MKPDSSPFSKQVWRNTVRRKQRGSIVVNTVIALSLIVIVLVGTELGYLFFMKREFQKTVDLAALAGAKKLMLPLSSTSCQEAKDAATLNAKENLPSVSLTTMECGRWDPKIANESHFDTDPKNHNALRVTISAPPPIALLPFGNNRIITTRAIAALADPVAAFSVGSRLLRVEPNGVLSGLLKNLGLNPKEADFLSYKGLAAVSIKPSGLLSQLGIPVSSALDVGTINNLAKVQSLTLGNLLDLSIAVLKQQGGAVSSQIKVLSDLQLGLDIAALNTHVQLFGDGKTPGLLVGLDSTGPSALEANVDVLSLVTAGLAVANGTNFITLENLGIPLLGVAAKASIIEAPSIGIGGVGTTARTAQVRVYLRADTSKSIVGVVLGFVGIQVDLPLIIELAQSTGKLTAIDCKIPRKTATIAVSSSAANICIGRFHDMESDRDSNNSRFFTKANRCAPDPDGQVPDTPDGVRRHQLLNVLDILPLKVRVGLPLLASQAPISTQPLSEPSVPPDGKETVTVNATKLDLAATADNVATAVVGGILGDLLGNIKASNPANAQSVAQQLVGTTGIGRSVSDVSNEIRFSADAMTDFNEKLKGQGLGGLLSGTLEGVGLLLNTILINPVVDVLCLLKIGETAIRNCRTDYIKNSVLSSGNNLVYTVLSGVLSLLEPLLDRLSDVISNLLTTLGLSIGQTDVSLISVDCGTSKLVY
ncbi:TadG family pilus assembly protein [Variovorax boronicumulans]|uniref:TadG family pilus assembly protein n=1 Tax=Variovorax boronicumulans TaxID=436515 RepID=UPI0027DDEEF6